MEKPLSTNLESNNSVLSETIRCATCDKEFTTPIFAVISSGYLIEEYYACPRCLSKVTKIEASKTIEVEETEEAPAQKIEIAIEEKREDTFACSHHLGYLKQRPKSTPIPEECLTCAKMIECMT
ncbi:MAG: hypothetical protein ACPLKZ_05595 [Candidatus Bathyarchaeales archaeon]